MPACLQWGEERHQECTQTADQGYNECAATADQGYSQCAATADQGYSQCCTWWPCSWGCKAVVWVSNIVCVAWTWVSNIVCVAWTWVSNVVCVAWTWITTAVCLVWDVVTTIVNAVLVTLESIFGWVLSAITFIIEALEMIPVLGTLIRWVLNTITHILGWIASLFDALLGLIGIRPEKKLRVCTVILRDERGQEVATLAEAVALLQLAVDVYKRDANVRIVPLRAFYYGTGFSGPGTVDDSWVVMDSAHSDGTLLDVACQGPGEWLLTGSGFQVKTSTLCFFGSWRRVLGYGSPVTCFIIRDVTDDAIGCQIWSTDYALVEGGIVFPPPGVSPSPRTLGHEVGHACTLGHRCVDEDNRNMMGTQGECEPDSTTPPDRVNPRMNNTQALLVRMSKHVSYF